MAIIQCPSCNKRVSSRAEVCPHCDFQLAGRSPDELEQAQQRALQRRKEKLLGQSMLALLVAIGGFAYSFLEQPHPESWQAAVSYGAMALGLVWFIVNRVRILMVKRSR
jgi:hypothetical protein